MARLEFDGRDEMGYDSKKFIYAEVMGKNSNLIFTDGNGKILGAMRQVDFTTSRLRQVLPGMLYELPPAQDKRDPLTETRDEFLALLGECIPERSAAKHINATYLGISPTVAREIAFRAAGSTDATVGGCSGYLLWREFSKCLMYHGNFWWMDLGGGWFSCVQIVRCQVLCRCIRCDVL